MKRRAQAHCIRRHVTTQKRNAPRSEYAQQQRRRILEAARQCCIANGLEATSMSDIAAEASISISLLYRYFANKRAIILAMVGMQLAEDRRNLDSVPPTTNFIAELSRAYAAWGRGAADVRHVGFLSEITALGLRDKAVAKVLRQFERESRDDLVKWLQRRADSRGTEVPESELQLRAIFLRCFVAGLAVHAVHDPELAPELLHGLLGRAMAQILEGDAAAA